MIDRCQPEYPTRTRAEIADATSGTWTTFIRTGPRGKSALAELERRIGEYAGLKGTLANGPGQLLAAYQLNDELGPARLQGLFLPCLKYDEDQRDNQVNARRQQVQALMARWQEATSWLSPELLSIPLADRARSGWRRTPISRIYRFAIEEVYRQQEHVLDEKGERLMSLSSRLSGAPNEAYQALSTADAKFPEITLSTGEKVTMSYSQYRAVLATNRNQADRRAAFLAHYGTFAEERQHVRVALPQRLPARLVPRARARLQDDARCRAARQRHPALGGGHPDRSHPRRRARRCAATIGCAAAR